MRGFLMNGAGNAFLVLDARGTDAPRPDGARVRALAADYGFDQLLIAEDDSAADAFMRVFNADGGESGACGNGARCVAWLVMEDAGSDAVALNSAGGRLPAARTGKARVRVDLGPARTDWREIPLARAMDTAALDYSVDAGNGRRLAAPGAVSMGNPHCVFFVEDAERLPARAIGHRVEHDPLFPERVNVGFAQILAPDRIRLKVWERGAGLTKACGTGAAAALVAAARRELTGRTATIVADGGDLTVDWRADGHVTLEGPVETTGEVELAL